MSYRVLICDDHWVIRRGLRTTLESISGVEVCCEAADGATAIDQTKRERPDLLLLDLRLPDINGLEIIRRLHHECPHTRVLVITMYDSRETAANALALGAAGYIMKTDGAETLVSAIREVRERGCYWSESIRASNREKGEVSFESGRLSLVTPREIEVLQLLADGRTNRETAEALKISPRTVEAHRASLMYKANVKSWADLLRWAIAHSIVPLS